MRTDPTSTIAAPRRGRHLPSVLSVRQVEALLATVTGHEPTDP